MRASVQGDDFSAPDAVVYQFDFESTNQCWAIRTLNGIPFGIPGSEQVVNGTCPGCSGTKSLQFQVNFQVANDHKGQIEYSSERGCPLARPIPATAEFSTWIYLEQDGPGNLEAEFWVQDTEAHNWAWHASRPTVALQPGQWVRLIGEGSWTSNAWFNPVLKFGIEIKFSAAPKPARGFWQSLKDLGIARAWVIAPVTRRYPLAEGVDVLPLQELGALWA